MISTLTTAFNYEGKHYIGVNFESGVTLTFKKVDCVADKTQVIFNGGDKSPNIFVEDVTSASETENGVKNSLVGKILGRPGYLNIKKV